jgi:hypothetical protein
LIVHRADMPLLPGNLGNLPKFGFGLWERPVASLTVELVLVVAGTFLYWRAARGAVRAAGGVGKSRADLAASLMLIAGCAVLYLDVTG